MCRRQPAIRTRFPPEPNATCTSARESICLNFGLAIDYKGSCHLRFDDTTRKGRTGIRRLDRRGRQMAVASTGPNLYFASDYFDFMYEAAEALIGAGHAYSTSRAPRKYVPAASR